MLSFLLKLELLKFDDTSLDVVGDNSLEACDLTCFGHVPLVHLPSICIKELRNVPSIKLTLELYDTVDGLASLSRDLIICSTISIILSSSPASLLEDAISKY